MRLADRHVSCLHNRGKVFNSEVSRWIQNAYDVHLDCRVKFPQLHSNIRHVRQEAIQFTIQCQTAAQIGIDSHQRCFLSSVLHVFPTYVRVDNIQRKHCSFFFSVIRHWTLVSANFLQTETALHMVTVFWNRRLTYDRVLVIRHHYKISSQHLNTYVFVSFVSFCIPALMDVL